jgi:apolipoprotein N-acyltransferase
MGSNHDVTTKDVAFAAITGIIYPLAFVLPYVGILAFILMVPLLHAVREKPPIRSFFLGCIAGVLANFIGHYWLVGTLTRFGGFPIALSAFMHIVVSTFFGLLFGLGCYFSSLLRVFDEFSIKNGFVFASIWTSLEFFYPLLFPYGITNFLSDYTLLIQVYDLFGVYFLSFVVFFVNFTVYGAIAQMRSRRHLPLGSIALSVALIVSIVLYGVYRIGSVGGAISSARKIKIGVIQANFDIFEKNSMNEDAMLSRFRSMSMELHSPDLVIWPETAVQSWVPAHSDYFESEGEVVVPSMDGAYFLSGGLSYDIGYGDDYNDTDTIEQFNVAFLTDSRGRILGTYRKIKLLLFGEYLPFSKYFPSIKNISPASGDFTPGRELSILEVKEKGIRIAPLICYEDILPSFTRRFVSKGANLIVNITNDAWFGDTFAPYQHLKLSIPRAVETRRYLIRSTNTGVSAVIDPLGRVTHKTPTFKEATIEAEVGLIDGGLTLYAKIGDVFPWTCGVCSVIYGAFLFLRKRYFAQSG